VAAYYNRLAAEAPPQARQEIKQIASAYRGLAASISAGNSVSLSKVEQQITSLTTSGAAATAFKRLIVYLTTKCGPSEVSG
jgi:DNA-binding transcriptional regulator/RsmH inhibitor MraZ